MVVELLAPLNLTFIGIVPMTDSSRLSVLFSTLFPRLIFLDERLSCFINLGPQHTTDAPVSAIPWTTTELGFDRSDAL